MNTANHERETAPPGQRRQKRTGTLTTPAEAVRDARVPRCPMAPKRYAWDLRSGKAFQLSCGRWRCVSCGRRNRAVAHRLFMEGLRAAQARGEFVRFMTLTMEDADARVGDLYASWDRMRAALRRVSKSHPVPRLRQYAAVVEAQARGALHLHIVCTGEFIPQRELSRLAVAAGFGRIADIRILHDPRRSAAGSGHERERERVADYLADYLAASEGGGSKDPDGARWKAFQDRCEQRVRPVRNSRGWGCTMAEARQLLAEEAERASSESGAAGSWVMVQIGDDGRMTLYADGGEVSAADIGDRQIALLMERFGCVPWLPPEMRPPPAPAPAPALLQPAPAQQLALV